MTKGKDISPERRFAIALNHILQAERHVNAVTINNTALTDHLTETKRLLLFVLSTLSQGNREP